MIVSKVTLQVLSGLLAVVPIALGVRILKSTKIPGILVFFLTVGVVTDVSMGMIVKAGNIPLATKVFQVYSLFEALIFLLLVRLLTPVETIKRISFYAMLLVPAFWFGCMVVMPLFVAGNRGSAIFDSGYEIVVAFLTGFAILSLAEIETNLARSPKFWLLFALFFYCFCTFFIMIFVKTLLSLQIWFINNIVNVITYGLYSIGLLKIRGDNRA